MTAEYHLRRRPVRKARYHLFMNAHEWPASFCHLVNRQLDDDVVTGTEDELAQIMLDDGQRTCQRCLTSLEVGSSPVGFRVVAG